MLCCITNNKSGAMALLDMLYNKCNGLIWSVKYTLKFCNGGGSYTKRPPPK